jgi:TolB-like protein/class 3 adenylate cyclase/tetratricopeptide (TPR) repeat protein
MKAETSPIAIDLSREPAFALGGVEVRPSTREVVIGERRQVLEPRVMQVLVALARRRGEVVSRGDLVDACWGGRAVGEDAINRGIAGVRRLAEACGGFSVETVARVGYRLTAQAAPAASAPGAPLPAPGALPEAAATAGPPASPVVQSGAAAILHVEIVGAERLAQGGETGAPAMSRVILDHLARLIEAHAGRGVSFRADRSVAVFAECAAALDCAQAFERQIAEFRLGVAADRAIHCRSGVHFGAVAALEGEPSGETVDIAARIAATAAPSTILVSDAARSAARRGPPMEPLGFHQLKDIATPIRLWRLSSSEADLATAPAGLAIETSPDVLGGGRPTIAVLPFEHPADDREQTYLAEGVTEDVIGALSRFKWLFVLSRHSTLNYRKTVADLSQVRADLGVRYIVTGRSMVNNGKLRLAVSLTDSAMGDTLWSRRFEGPMSDIFDMQDEITATIVGALEPALLRREEAGAARPAPRSLKHWDLFIRGRWHFWQLSYGHVAKAREILTQALAVRPDDAPTLSLLAYTHFTRLWAGWTLDPDDDLAQSRRLAMRAVRLDPDDAFAHYTFGIALTLTGELDRAMAEQRRALELNPNFAAAMAEMGRCLAFSGVHDEAIAFLDRAIRSSPGDSHYFLWFRDKAIAGFTSARYEEAVAFANEAAALRPDIFFNHYLLAASWAGLGDMDKARSCFAEGRRLLPNYPLKTLKFGHPFARPADLDRFVDGLRRCGWTEQGD